MRKKKQEEANVVTVSLSKMTKNTKNTEQLEEIEDKNQEEQAGRTSTKNRLNSKCRGFKENTTVYEGFEQNKR